MSFRKLSPQAMKDLEEIVIYIAQDKPGAARKWLKRIDDIFDTLAEQPMTGVARPELKDGVRSFVYTPYVIFYEPMKGGVGILRVLHGARDIDRNDFGNQ